MNFGFVSDGVSRKVAGQTLESVEFRMNHCDASFHSRFTFVHVTNRRYSHTQSFNHSYELRANLVMYYLFIYSFYYRAMLCIRGTSHGPVSVCLSVCLCLSVCHKSESY